jgi:hypothetical protein
MALMDRAITPYALPFESLPTLMLVRPLPSEVHVRPPLIEYW